MAKRHKRMKAKKAFKMKLKPSTVFSIAQILFFSLAGLIIVSFTRQGVILVRFNDYLVKFFSWASILLPFIFISFALLISKLKTPLGQPNVIIGSLLFFISITAMTRAGIVGKGSWYGIVTLITSVGAFILLLGTTLVGLIILFNTSLDQVFGGLINVFKKYGVRGKLPSKFPSIGKKSLKVFGDINQGGVNPIKASSSQAQPSKLHVPGEGVLEQKLVTNLPGEDKIWKYPPIEILSDSVSGKADRGDIKGNAATIEQTLESFGIAARVVEVNLGPAVTQYALEVGLGTKLSKITGLERDLALAFAAPTGTIRIEAPIPGRSLVGIELPNRSAEFVSLRKMLESEEMSSHKSKLAVSLGLDVSGKPILADLARMPHVLVAGQTGSGKSICINAFLSTLLFRASPSEIKFILVDP